VLFGGYSGIVILAAIIIVCSMIIIEKLNDIKMKLDERDK